MRTHSEQAAVEASLRAAIADRDTLFSELEHRTRNNMQMISAFLLLQASRADSAETKAALDDIMRRVDALNITQQALSRLAAVDRVDLGEYLPTVMQGLMQLEGRPGIRLQTHVTQRVETSVHQGQLLGMLIGEIATNALKHAFPRGGGVLGLSLSSCGSERAAIEVYDDGVGWPASAGDVPYRPGGLGLRLIEALSRQAGAELRIDGSHGVRAIIDFHTESRADHPMPCLA